MDLAGRVPGADLPAGNPRLRSGLGRATRVRRLKRTGPVPGSRTLQPMAERPLTLMAVHAHPDDEAIGTGGILARYADEGVRTVLGTCTNGGLGEPPGGLK